MEKIKELKHQPLIEVDIAKEINVEKISETHYTGLKPLLKPYLGRRGVYGGAICAQAVLVAIRSSPKGFRPNAMHTFFIRAVDEESVIDWKVQKISNGRSFVNRSVNAIQNGKPVFTANISLTLNNTLKLETKLRQGQGLELELGSKTFTYQATPGPKLDICNLREAELLGNSILHVSIKFPVASQPVDVLPYFIKYGVEGRETIRPLTPEYEYCAFTWITDWMELDRVLDVMGYKDIIATFDASLDHTVYFHDDDLDPTHWIAVSFKTTRLNHDRALLICNMFNDKGVHVATVVQERLFKGNFDKNKL